MTDNPEQDDHYKRATAEIVLMLDSLAAALSHPPTADTVDVGAVLGGIQVVAELRHMMRTGGDVPEDDRAAYLRYVDRRYREAYRELDKLTKAA